MDSHEYTLLLSKINLGKITENPSNEEIVRERNKKIHGPDKRYFLWVGVGEGKLVDVFLAEMIKAIPMTGNHESYFMITSFNRLRTIELLESLC